MIRIDAGSVSTIGYVGDIISHALAPVFLLAGIGGLLNVCAMRIARIVDRAKAIEPELLASRDLEHERLQGELRVLDRRIVIVNWAIFFTVVSAIMVCAVVVLLFADPFTATPLGSAIAILFMASGITISLGFFIFLVETRLDSRSARVRTDLLEHQPD